MNKIVIVSLLVFLTAYWSKPYKTILYSKSLTGESVPLRLFHSKESLKECENALKQFREIYESELYCAIDQN